VRRATYPERVTWPVAAGGLILFALNAYTAGPWFGIEYLDGRQSIEGAFIGLARYILHNPAQTAWFPFWYNGVPFENTYPPLLNYAVAGSAWLTGLSVPRAYHVVTGVFYCLGPVALYALAYRLSRSLAPSFFAGLLFSLLSPSLWILPKILADSFSPWIPRRFHVLAWYGGGPQIVALTLVMVAILALDFALSKPRPHRLFLGAAAVAAALLTNWVGAFALAWAAVAYWVCQRRLNLRAAAAFLALIGIFAYALVLRWLPPTTVADIARNAQISGGHYPMDAGRVAGLMAFLVLMVGIGFVLRRTSLDPALCFGLVLAVPMWGIPGLEEATGFYVIPQPHRYQVETELAAALAIAFPLTRLIARTPAVFRVAAVLAAAAAAIVQTSQYRSYADRWVRPVDVEKTLEWQVGDQVARRYPGRRLYAVGSVRYWLPAFHDIAQFGGGFGPGIRLPQWWITDYAIHWPKGHGQLTTAWLRAYGVDLVCAGDERTLDVWRVWRDPGKFDRILPVVWRSGGDAIYEVPRRSRSLAHIVPEASLVRRAPEDLLDSLEIERYVEALEDARNPVATFRWLSASAAAIEVDEARPDSGQALSVQIAFDRRWRVECDGKRLESFPDGLGQLVIRPPGPGRRRIFLTFEPEAATRVLTAVAWLAGMLSLAWVPGGGFLARRRDITPPG